MRRVSSGGLFALADCSWRAAPWAELPASRGSDSADLSWAGQYASSVNDRSLGDEKWWTVFNDPALQHLIRTALKQNYESCRLRLRACCRRSSR